ncbi:hypothetical protein ACFFSH_09945 [Streptomyces filamentosus]|uniref:Uncharacterized protein n=1 Tax=Streptomyces filamentosus TaxID=67294 RepID=A0A919BHM6_STRFL|nr:hypothetical protein [Streptomyces filamentosus]GHF88133.1 hypothetical protein GCM10017667_16020 [Streptomyces filamentosus]
MTSSTGRSLPELIGGADERGLAAAGLACLDRCLPLLAPDRTEVLRPVWAAVARGDGGAWSEAVAGARVELDGAGGGAAGDGGVVTMVRALLDGVPAAWAEEPLRTWAERCSAVALAVHRLYDVNEDGPLHAGELRRQLAVLDSVAHGPTGLRRARELSTEGGRVLRAVVSRRARTA